MLWETTLGAQGEVRFARLSLSPLWRLAVVTTAQDPGRRASFQVRTLRSRARLSPPPRSSVGGTGGAASRVGMATTASGRGFVTVPIIDNVTLSAARWWSSQDSVDTLAPRFVGRFELLGADASEMAMAT